jgi:hypothetical protein
MQCSQHWLKVLDPCIVKGFWTDDEDTLLLKLKLESAESTWSEIAVKIHGRSAKQCRERWDNSLNPVLKRCPFSEKEDRILVKEWMVCGPRWAVIATQLPGRTQTKIRDRFKTLRIRYRAEIEAWERNQEVPVSISGQGSSDEQTASPESIAVANEEEKGGKNRTWCFKSMSVQKKETKEPLKKEVEEVEDEGVDESAQVVEEAPFSDEEDRIVAQEYTICGPRWNVIASKLPGRTQTQIRDRFKTLRNQNRAESKDAERGGEANHEDLVSSLVTLSSLASSCSSVCSSTNLSIAAHTIYQSINSSTAGSSSSSTSSGGASVPFAEVMALAQPINASNSASRVFRVWRPEEDAMLVSAVDKNGERNWKQVASEVGTRTQVQCAQRWRKALKPGLHKGPWKQGEDELLRQLVAEHGKNWPKIAEKWTDSAGDLKVRTVNQIRARWHNHVDPAVSRLPFSREEDQTIMALHQTLGNAWSAIAKNLPGRVGEAVKSRFKSLSRRQQNPSKRKHPSTTVVLDPCIVKDLVEAAAAAAKSKPSSATEEAEAAAEEAAAAKSKEAALRRALAQQKKRMQHLEALLQEHTDSTATTDSTDPTDPAASTSATGAKRKSSTTSASAGASTKKSRTIAADEQGGLYALAQTAEAYEQSGQ